MTESARALAEPDRAGAAAVPAGAREAIAAVADGFAESDAQLVSTDPLGWPGYGAQRERARDRSGEPESVLCGAARIGGRDVELIAFDFRFMGGSMGEAAGRKITRALDRAVAARRPVVSLVVSGGCRMQEGMRSLVQMQAIAAGCHRLRAAGLPHVAALRSPTTGGVWAALAAGADVILAVDGATVAFAGHRVRGAATDDAEAFTAEGKRAAGQVDAVVADADLRATLALAVELLAPSGEAAPAPADVPAALGRDDLPADGWAAVTRARDPGRPRAEAYLDRYFDTRLALCGDRAGGSDAGMLCGIGRRGGRAIAYAAQAGVANTPAGYRTATRLIGLADRLGLPVLTLVDTPGAANDAPAERAAVGPAINATFAAVAAARVPITTLVVGEGGSGGALALASATDMWIAPDGYFAVIAPEAATAILKGAEDDVPQTAERLRLRPQELLGLGIVQGIAGREATPPRTVG
ncbi:MAG: acyl-CoA carboxylase subunit beta [Solirubrobacteraceae bacterium]|nr:acyl-CoA carboxylase subunit beta [Solirubrobacteraceae bacterium]